jgi:hypothetical protein
MRIGCFGCFFLVVVALAILVFGIGALLVSANIFRVPDVRAIAFSKADGYAAQQKLYEILLRQMGKSARKDPIILSEREVGAFLSNHLAESARLPLSPLAVRFERGQLFVQGQTALRNLFQGPVFAQLLSHISDTRFEQPVWVSMRGRLEVEAPAVGTHYGTLTVTDLELGRQHLSPFLIYVMLGPTGGGLLRWQVPAVVESIQIEPSQAIIRTR